ncbi:PDZ domain-containing protein [Sutcliffiella halmapala]|uniref:PDZ domain-containing protein n=1 Tax=Sutcliffiella halmapala TaxID=79882 RepID=UPI000995994D|nr:PDZ domain-containing protein [Sutcliffiella halmapala]
MIESWLLELLKGVGRLFIHPVFYVTLALAVVLGYFRVKRERHDFHIRIEYGLTEFQKACKTLVLGLVLSFVTVGLGLILPFGTIFLISLVTVFFALFIKPRWLSTGYIVGFSLLLAVLLPKWTTGIESVDSLFSSIGETHLPSLAILMGLLMIVEGILVSKQASIQTSPQLAKSKRGLPVGSHIAQRVWVLPLFLFVPGEGLSTTFEWWPVLQMGEQSLSLWLVPFGMGFYQRIKASLPRETVAITGRQLSALGALILCLAISSVWWEVIAIIAAVIAVFAREWIHYLVRVHDDKNQPIFVQRDEGLIILGVIPESPAGKMNLLIGEIIVKVNGQSVSTVEGFYEALQHNRAFCKLQVVDDNGEARFAQCAIYEGDHHELGLLFVQDGKKWKRTVAG